jgi:ribokinase
LGEIVVVGAINVDLVAAVPRLPGRGETVVGTSLERYGGGKGANAAVAAARTGAQVRLIGAVGADDLGEGAVAELGGEGINVDDVAVLEGPSTGVALIVVDAEGENQIAVAAGANGAIDAAAVRRAIERVGARAAGVIVSTEIHGSAVATAVETATRIGVPCVLNPAPVVPEVVDLLRHGPILTPNATECAALAAALDHKARSDVGASPADKELEEAARSIAVRSGAPVVVTLGAKGALVVDAGGHVEQVATRQVAVVDTTGAGDVFNGVLATRLGAGDHLIDAVRAATDAASLSVSIAGARGAPAGGSRRSPAT